MNGPPLAMLVPTWMDDYSQRLVVDEGGNTMRWMHVTPGKQIIEACDRQGLMMAMPAGDQEGDVTGRQWDQRTELMRDAIIYNKNNPSILFYECGNTGITEIPDDSNERDSRPIRSVRRSRHRLPRNGGQHECRIRRRDALH